MFIQKYLKTSFLSTLMGPKDHFMGSINLKMGFSSNLFLISNRSIEKNTFIYKNIQKYPKTSFSSTFMSFTGPKPHFYVSLKPQNGFIK